MPELSIIMSTYKEPIELLRLSIESILNQSYKDFEFIIVIDSPDNANLINELKAYSKNDSRIVLLYNEKNIGLTASLNRALKKSNGKILARMDADDISDYNRIEEQIKYLKIHKLDLVGCEVRRINEFGDVIAKKTNISKSPKCISELLMFDNCVPHPTWVGKREVFELVNGYRDIYTCEDYDFLLRCLKAGVKIGICDKVLFSYRINENGISRSNSLRQQFSAKYLREHFDLLESIDQTMVDKYISPINTKAKAVKYEKAILRLNSGLTKIKEGKKTGYRDVISSVIISPLIIDNLKRIIKMNRIRKKYRTMSK